MSAVCLGYCQTFQVEDSVQRCASAKGCDINFAFMSPSILLTSRYWLELVLLSPPPEITPNFSLIVLRAALCLLSNKGFSSARYLGGMSRRTPVNSSGTAHLLKVRHVLKDLNQGRAPRSCDIHQKCHQSLSLFFKIYLFIFNASSFK